MALQDPTEQLRHVLESGRNIKFGRGVIGKTSHVVMGVIALWAIILWRWSDNLIVDAGLLLVGIIATLFAAWWVHASQGFAERNPAQALLEGTDFVEYRRLEVQQKGGVVVESGTPVELIEGKPPVVAEEEI